MSTETHIETAGKKFTVTIEQFNAVTGEQVRELAADLITRQRSIVGVGDITEAAFEEFL